MGRNRWPKGTWMKLASGATLRALMDQRGFSNEDVARAAGCGRTFISALVNGRRNSCKPETADRIALCLQVPVTVLFVPQQSPTGGRSVTGRKKAAAA